ncbi:MAG: 2-oxoacid:acceptor oxidoreductase family protein [Candidatus Helarchaeota archaeon]|nr:2-oxoacid:acceptor oxidoreductase family protein [Candidatus Helarchaeota archaeon]
MTRTEIKIAGYGGQGVITLSKMIAAAAILHQKGITATQTEAYGAQARGGACWAEVVLSDEDMIDYPRAIVPVDVLMVFSEEAARNYRGDVKKGGIAIFDPLTVREKRFRVKATKFPIPANQIATEELKMPVAQNSIMFGAFVGITGLITEESGKICVENFVPKKFIDINLKAYEKGLEIGKKLKTETDS